MFSFRKLQRSNSLQAVTKSEKESVTVSVRFRGRWQSGQRRAARAEADTVEARGEGQPGQGPGGVALLETVAYLLQTTS